ncbi:hypothetical protein [Leptothoe sp. PORK10 BA2]|uniref:hypothetical protein n=1 Tax=Leptothoe sp. PORK10 BA2 TaxID=3110254 RepID=UPI002B1FD764|nr:hypothetical protein [Leptothoe sp. PORK10 BA2]MEA5463646.1 hypothetical protein [Leptothoe sp. PORK10 BA2]
MLHSQLVSISTLSDDDRGAMYHLLTHHFQGVTSDIFAQDLAHKNWVILIKNKQLQLKGFSTLQLYDVSIHGEDIGREDISVVYSGDTIVDPTAWSSATLPRAWIQSINQLRCPNKRLFWLLISSGFRTYRLLPTFWQVFYPRHDQSTPEAMQQLMHTLAQQQFGAAYDRETGIVRFPHPQKLSPILGTISPERRRDPHIHFFEQTNRGHSQGDELVCLTEICADNLTAVGRRMWFGRSLAA